MIRFSTACALAGLCHLALFALAGALLTRRAPSAAVPAPELQVTTVELSLAEEDTAEGAVGAPAAAESAPAPTPPPVEHALEPMPDLPVREDGLIPAAPEIRVAEYTMKPALPDAPTAASAPAAADLPTAAETRETARVDVPPQPRAAFRPVYPRGCRTRGEAGVVTLAIDVSAAGTVHAVRVEKSSGFPELDAAAVAAARRARFTPASRAGQPVAGTVRLPIQFRLHDR